MASDLDTPQRPWLEATLTTDWQGTEVLTRTPVEVKAFLDDDALQLHITAPHYQNAPPPHAPGSTPKLWEHEVVELFILGEDRRYLEMEFGPHGHYLLLTMHGERQLVEQGMRCAYEASIEGDVWRARATIDRALLPAAAAQFNLYAIHDDSSRQGRRFLALSHAPDASQPDFHRLDAFLPIPNSEQKAQ